MRTLGFRTHLVLVIAGAAGLVLSLMRPWYAAAPVVDNGIDKPIGDVNGPLDGLFAGLRRAFTDSSGVQGWQALDHWSLAIAAMAALAAAGALLCLTPIQSLGRDLLRYGAMAAAGVTFWKLVDTPGPNAALELRYGALVGGAFALMLLTCGLGVANAPLRRRVVTPPYQAPPPPIWTDTAGSTAPPSV
jgi:hypothetical protein